MTKPTLLQCSMPVITLLKSVVVDGARNENVRDLFIAALQTFEDQARAAQQDTQAIAHAKYAWVALIDEILMRSDDAVRAGWIAHPLQLSVYGEHVAGEGFFQRLHSLYQAEVTQPEVLEVYFVCLQLGLEGKYRLKGTSALNVLKAQVWKQLQAAYETHAPVQLPPPEKKSSEGSSLRTLYLSVLVFLCVVYGVYRIVNSVTASPVVEAVRGDVFFTHI